MDMEYDSKFEEMKKYIPFLESMIKRLESTSSASQNPRQAQLDKIRSLRDLLMDKKKRMKMENLLKCEQVLVNLYAKVEQRDTLPEIKKESEDTCSRTLQTNNTPDLSIARSKLKCAVAMFVKEEPDTLPEIARASESEVICSPGSKEPALFQRRPNIKSISPPKHSPNKLKGKSSPQKGKRNYTRVLLSPEPSVRRWTTCEGTSDKPLYSRRSPRRSPRRYSPSYNKRERKKVSKPKSYPKEHEDLNITLNVPEESLSSLNTTDILSRIITCNDNDVNIDTLRELRSQILGELKQTGNSDDISDLILKSYKNKKRNKIGGKKSEDVEEGEISDSESEAIDRIYGNLVIVDQNKDSDDNEIIKTSDDSNNSRKIQICLVINSDAGKNTANNTADEAQQLTDDTDFKMYEDISDTEISSSNSISKRASSDDDIKKIEKQVSKISTSRENKSQDQEVITIEDDDDHDKSNQNRDKNNKKHVDDASSIKKNYRIGSNNNVICPMKIDNSTAKIDSNSTTFSDDNTSTSKIDNSILEINNSVSKIGIKVVNETFTSYSCQDKNYSLVEEKCNNEQKEQDKIELKNVTKVKNNGSNDSESPSAQQCSPVPNNGPSSKDEDLLKDIQTEHGTLFTANFYKPLLKQEDTNIKSNQSEIVKLNPTSKPIELTKNVERQIDVTSEKETTDIPFLGSDNASVVKPSKTDAISEIEILQALKNEILSENIAIPGAKVDTPLLHQPKVTKVLNSQQVIPKKRISIEKYKEKSVASSSTSLFIKDPNMSNSIDDNVKKQSLKLTEKECERFNFPSKLALNESSEDEDKDVSSLSLDDIYGDLAPKSPDYDILSDVGSTTPVIIPAEPVEQTKNAQEDIDMRKITSPSINKEILREKSKSEIKLDYDMKVNKPLLVDPRVRRDINQIIPSSPNPNIERIPMSTSVKHPNMTPSMTPNAKGFNMTPTYTPFDIENTPGKKHVYTPILPICDGRELERSKERINIYWESDINKEDKKSRWEMAFNARDGNRKWENFNPKSNSVQRDDVNRHNRYSLDKKDNYAAYDRSECPRTPNHPFGRSDCPRTPSHPFGRTDGQQTPSHHFGRSDCPQTPSHSFGRSECPLTPNHPFGRSEGSQTPSHSFGRNDCPPASHPFGRLEAPLTPSHPFGRSDGPSTPTNHFGRLEAPLTPVHPFGRSEGSVTPSHTFGRSEMPRTPSHPFGRSDYQQNHHGSARFGRGYTKDPRLNRNLENDNLQTNQSYSHDRVHGYGRDSNISRFNSESFRNYSREQSVGRSDRHFPNDRTHYQRDNMHRNEPSVGRTIYKEYEEERPFSRDHDVRNSQTEYGKDKENSRSYDAYRRDNLREPSVGRSSQSEVLHSRSRASSVGRSFDEHNDNKLSIKSHAGRSFTIDTSISRTFQETLDNRKDLDYKNDYRKQRSGSVGRTLVREPCVGRSFANVSNCDKTKNDRFRRACSVGRDIISTGSDKSFQDVKAHFESYKCNKEKDNRLRPVNETNKTMGSSSKRDIYEHEKDRRLLSNIKRGSYSPRKNYRDPRLRREQHDLSNKNDRNRNTSGRSSYGIVYSNDNIAKGTILGPGYGVKNYKIPKIKRVVEDTEKDTKDLIEDKEKSEDVTNNISTTSLKTERMPSKSNKTSEQLEEKMKNNAKKSKSKKTKKAVIYDSDSDHIADETSNPIKSSDAQSSENITDSNVAFSSPNPTIKQNDDNFNLDDLDLFTDNIGSDPVLDNINALIADLDNEIDATKTETEKKTKVVEKGLDDTIRPNTEYSAEDDTLNVISEFIRDDLSDIEKNIIQQDSCTDKSKVLGTDNKKEGHKENPALDQKNLESENGMTDSLKQSKDSALKTDMPEKDSSAIKSVFFKEVQTEKYQNPHSVDRSNGDEVTDILRKTISDYDESNDAIVSTTEFENRNDEMVLSNNHINEKNEDVCSTPDSTNETNDVHEKPIEEERKPDSTNEFQRERKLSSDITSTHDTLLTDFKENSEPSSSQKPTLDQIDPIGSLLSILQNKTKIKELLNKLGDTSTENEKLIKKLEKLSEIVSDEEDTDDTVDIYKEPISNNKTEVPDKNYDKREIQAKISFVNQPVEEITSGKELLNNNKGTCGRTQAIKSDELIKNNEGISNCKQSIAGGEVIKGNEEISDSNQLMEGDELVRDNQETSDSKQSMKVEELTKDNVESSDGKLSTVDDEIQNGTVRTAASSKKSKKLVQKRKKHINKTKSKGKVVCKPDGEKRITRSEASSLVTEKPTKKNCLIRELGRLQEDIKEMFMSNDILNDTGIRMCRLAKLVDGKNSKGNNASKEFTQVKESEPVVVLEKFKNDAEDTAHKLKKKPGPKQKFKSNLNSSTTDSKLESSKNPSKYLPGPKSKKKKNKNEDVDPYAFETDSMAESNSVKDSEKSLQNSSDSDNESIDSSKSPESSELLIEYKKAKKRKRPGWQAGIIKPKSKKKKIEIKQTELTSGDVPMAETHDAIPDLNCFTDKTYCFVKNVFTYSCRLCKYIGPEIVHHYKKQHPHSEIPLSRMSPEIAKEAIEQCEEINFTAISKIPTDRYVCRFCFKEFAKKKAILETFFWHVVSTHTGEFKQLCSECINVTRCPFNLDIPPPPKDAKGQLIGYICGKCNFTQISLENLKTHVIVRHNDEQTEVYTINLAMMSKRTINTLSKRCETSSRPRLLRSSRSNQSITEPSDEHSDATDVSDSDVLKQQLLKLDSKLTTETTTKSGNVQSKITFETDDDVSETSMTQNDKSLEDPVKLENEDISSKDGKMDYNKSGVDESKVFETNTSKQISEIKELEQNIVSDDVLVYPHFKINYTATGTREYVCCINGNDNHYQTTFQISIKKHVQINHKEKWDGYCFVCKVIVTPQGVHSFKDCLLHYLDKHMDNFPVLEKVSDNIPINTPESRTSPITYIQVRPLSELMSRDVQPLDISVSPPVLDTTTVLPLVTTVQSNIKHVPSVDSPSIEKSSQSSNYTYPRRKVCEAPKEYKYEEVQADVMQKKHRVVLETMMSKSKLIHVFKCAGRYCSYSSDSAEDALLHASTHQRVGGENALNCAYCDFDSSVNAIDLIMHVFKVHGPCQYVCGQCFYRAAASQLVGAHITRVHQESPVMQVLRSTTVVTSTTVESSKAMLIREAAVQYFICNNADGDSAQDTCKFRTYTPNKFYEHLTQKHASAAGYSCNICNCVSSSPAELIQHMKSHGIKMYQCTWCVYGAENEAELLAHASAKHPDKEPQAYLRIVTTKEGSTELRVLPLVQFNKSKVPSEDVTPNTNTGNPVREAERSIELENLISQTMLMIESRARESPPENTEEDTDLICNDDNPIESPGDHVISNISEIPSCLPTPSLVTPPRPKTPVSTDITSQLTPILKTEPIEMTPEKTFSSSDVIYSLDSDEEDSKQGIIDLSSDDAPSPCPKDPEPVLTPVKPTQIQTKSQATEPQQFSCGKCHLFYDDLSEFEKHIAVCYPNMKDSLMCPVCSYKTDKKNEIFAHISNCTTKKYGRGELRSNSTAKRHTCGVCECLAVHMADIKSHLRRNHGVTKIEVTSNYNKEGEIIYRLRPAQKKQTPGPKRKSSTGTPVKSTNKRYGPQDISMLPINPILDELVYCSVCEFNTKVRLNMVRHLQMHAEQQPVAQTVPVNPVPHLETNEKHFDKMVNLASSSSVTRVPDKTNRPETSLGVSVLIPPEAASRYPKYVPERQRHTCGAKGCSYISVDEAMLKYHWETLHAGTNDYRCVHCPPYQQLDTSKPLTASRIIAHLKMHDVRLYACSACSYYHYRQQVVEKHLSEVHKNGQILIVRKESDESSSSNQPQSSTSAPTMDLKPWQCGVCKFKSMLRQEVVEHCATSHLSKMQFKCSYCPFRTSTLENVTKHQSTSHPDKNEEVFYFYYREGSLPDEPDGTPRWAKQRQKLPNNAPEIKTEMVDNTVSTAVGPTSVIAAPLPVDLNVVKKEVEDQEIYNTLESLCKSYGQFCEPNGLKFKCPLCKVVVEDCKETMKSHLHEELGYRKWYCSICSYKAFHKKGLGEHLHSEHRISAEPLIEPLPLDLKIETWVNKLLDYQQNIINVNRSKIANVTSIAEPCAPVEKASAVSIITKPPNTPVDSAEVAKRSSMKELEEAFGQFGEPNNLQFSCPKCKFVVKEESAMQDHLETELTKIRWCCNKCVDKFQTYHAAQFHCKSVHSGASARPVEAIRDPVVRTAWIQAVIRVQKLSMNFMPVSDIRSKDVETIIPDNVILSRKESPEPPENSLLVVRYEEKVPTPEVQTTAKRRRSVAVNYDSDDSDDGKLVIDAPDEKLKKKCLYCDYKSKYKQALTIHILRHYNLKYYTCPYCEKTFTQKNTVYNHQEIVHPDKPKLAQNTEKPKGPPPNNNKNKIRELIERNDDDTPNLICLTCLQDFTETDALSHNHNNTHPQFLTLGNPPLECGICLKLFKDQAAALCHHNSCHSNSPEEIKVLKIYNCGYCNRNCKFLRDLKSHHKAVHSQMNLNFYLADKKKPVLANRGLSEDNEIGVKRKNIDDTIMPAPKRVAKKSTSKLPKVLTVARKSTTKLPLYVVVDSESEDDEIEYSYYGTKPRPWEHYDNVTTLMPFYNTVMPFSMKNLKAIIKIEPKVVVKDMYR